MSVFSLLMLIPFLKLLFYDGNYTNNNENYEELFLKIIAQHGKTNALIILCLIAVAVFFVKNLCRYLAQYILAPIRSGIMQLLRTRMYAHFLKKEIIEIEKLEKGKVLSLFMQDVQEVEYGLIYFSEAIVKEPIILGVTLSSLLWMNWKLTLIAIFLLIISAAIISKALRILKIKSQALQALQASNTAILSSTLQGFTLIKTMISTEYFIEIFNHIQQKWRQLQNVFLQRKELASPLAEFLGICVILVILCIGGTQVIQRELMTPEVFITFIVVFSQIINPAKSLSNAISNLQKSQVAWEHIHHFIGDNNDEHSNAITSSLTFQDSIQINNLGLYIDEKRIFSDIDFTVKKGEHWGVAGITGSGKSSLLKCILGISNYTEGSITIDGKPLNTIHTASLWDIMAFVPQEGVIFPMTIRDNIIMGRKFDTNQWQKAIDVVALDEIVSNLPASWDTLMDTEHLTLSGGERQRIAIARALLTEKPILIMDEATSALDVATEEYLFQNISKLYPDITMIGVTHRNMHKHLYDHWYHFPDY
jgi:subfamily B ATP-binding cassette protein MsbA